MEFILDTNAYRNLVEGLDFPEVYRLAKTLKSAEDKAGHTTALSIVVSMELIQHLLDGDAAKERCYKALCLQWYHTRRLDFKRTNLTGSFYPPMNIILAQIFFDNNSRYFPLYMKVLELVVELTKALDINLTTANGEHIKVVKKQVEFEKSEFKENVEDFLRSLNHGELNWKIISTNKERKKEFFDKLKNGDMEVLLGLGLLARAHQVMDKEDMDAAANSRFLKFTEDYRAALIMSAKILTSIGNGAELADIDDQRWNTLNDVQILFGLLYYREGIEKKLVTNDNAIKDSCTKAGIGNSVITIEQYKDLLGI